MRMNFTSVFVGIFVFLSFTFLARYALVSQAVYGDGIFYWAYTRSLVIDHNLDLSDEGSHMYSPQTNNDPTSYETPSDQNNLTNFRYYPIGSSLIWIPAFLFSHSLLGIISLLGIHVATNGYADPYQIIVGIGNIGLVTMGLYILLRLLSRFFPVKISLVTCLVLLFSTNLFYYGSIDVLNSHPAAFLLSSLFFYTWVTTIGRRSYKQFFLLGILLGCMTITRLQDSLFGIILLVEPFLLQKSERPAQTYPGYFIRQIPLIVLGYGVGLLPQMIASKIIFGSFFVIPYGVGSTSFNLFSPKFLEIFINPERGLFFYSPLFLVAMVGLFFISKKNVQLRMIQYAALIIIASEYILIAYWSGWSQGEAFGMRMFISLIPLLAFGMAMILTKLSKKLSGKTLIILSLCFVIHNMLMIASFHLFLHNPTIVGEQLSQSGQLRTKILEYVTR